MVKRLINKEITTKFKPGIKIAEMIEHRLKDYNIQRVFLIKLDESTALNKSNLYYRIEVNKGKKYYTRMYVSGLKEWDFQLNVNGVGKVNINA